jgi:hypothetical protein
MRDSPHHLRAFVPACLCAFAVLLGPVALAGCKGKPQANLSSPKAAAQSWASAMESGDTELAIACMVPQTVDKPLIEAQAKQFAALRKYESAARAKFAESAKQFEPSSTLAKRLEQADETIEGDSARLKMKLDSRGFYANAIPDELKFKKVSSRWLVEGGTVPTARRDQALKLLGSLEKLHNELADQINGDEIRSAAQATQERARRILALLGAAATTQP